MDKRHTILTITFLMTIFTCNRTVLKLDPSGICDKEKTVIHTVYPDFITASRNLDVEYMNKSASNKAQRKYANALQLLIDRQTDSAEICLSELVNDSTDTLIRT